MRKKFGRKLLLLRKARGLSQDELCANVDQQLTKAAYGKIERGISLPKIDTLDLITDALSLDYSYFYEDYLKLVHDKKTLSDFAWRCARMKNYTLARKITNKRIKLAKKKKERGEVIVCLFDLIIWGKQEGRAPSSRSLEYLSSHFHLLSQEQMKECFQNVFM